MTRVFACYVETNTLFSIIIIVIGISARVQRTATHRIREPFCGFCTLVSAFYETLYAVPANRIRSGADALPQRNKIKHNAAAPKINRTKTHATMPEQTKQHIGVRGLQRPPSQMRNGTD